MKPEDVSKLYLAITQSKGKMYEFDIAESDHIKINIEPSELAILAIGILGDFSYSYSKNLGDTRDIVDKQENLLFSARFFDAYINARLSTGVNPYLGLLGASAYYLSSLPGSAKVLAKSLKEQSLDVGGAGLEKLLLYMLLSDYEETLIPQEPYLGDTIAKIATLLRKFYTSGEGAENLLEMGKQLQTLVYESGTDRQLILADIIRALLYKHITSSCWVSLPKFSGMGIELWKPIIQKDNFIKELWPAQLKIGEAGVFSGKSAVIQMPTSAGKTKATEIIIRSAFLSGRTSFVVIVAPFKSLCHEIRADLEEAFQDEDVIVNELSDVYQMDFEFLLEEPRNRIAVVTPEKLVYMLRHNSEIGKKMGLLILDEAHQFDSGIRGVTYELLLTTLKDLLDISTQRVLISAVISNAEDISVWFGGESCSVVNGQGLVPTQRFVGFTEWTPTFKNIQYIAEGKVNEFSFWVPRVFEVTKLKKGRFELDFPNVDKPESIAVYLGLKQVDKGSIAIFCGQKAEIGTVCKYVKKIEQYGYDVSAPRKESSSAEIEKLVLLHKENLGEDSIYTECAKIGVFAHHANIPHGIKIAVEYAMRRELTKFVVCTSTLAQGVNFPLRYLIIKSLNQGKNQIKTRDFHNLMGRAGRSGMYTEGSILFANPKVYASRRSTYSWNAVTGLLDPAQSEPCSSTLLGVLDSIEITQHGARGKKSLDVFPLVLKLYLEEKNPAEDVLLLIQRKYPKVKNTYNIKLILQQKVDTIAAIESYLMDNIETEDSAEAGLAAKTLVENTLAYYLANEEQRNSLQNMFISLATNLVHKVPDTELRKVYGKTLFSLEQIKLIETWLLENVTALETASTEELIKITWPLLKSFITLKEFKESTNIDGLEKIVQMWVNGQPYWELLETVVVEDIRYHKGDTKTQGYNSDTIVDLCEQGFSYKGSLLVGAIIEMVQVMFEETTEIVKKLQLFQKNIKYGLKTRLPIYIHELGFSDRVIAQKIAEIIEDSEEWSTKGAIREKSAEILELLEIYPTYFSENIMKSILNQED